MAKPRIFVSSTYYDLRHVRKGIELFVENLGYDSILFESGDIPFTHDIPLDESCYKEIGSSHILVLIIGGRFGSQTSDSGVKLDSDALQRHYQHYNSITQRELETAMLEDIPVYIFVEKGVAAEYLTFKENRDNQTIKYAHVDSVNVFRLLDFIYTRKRNNLTKDFENIDDITDWLRDQWAGLFGEFLSKKAKERTLQTLQIQLSSLKNVTDTLKNYSENIIRGISPDKADDIIHDNETKQQEKVIVDLFASHHIIRHLVDIHAANLNEVIDSFKSAETLNDLRAKILATVPETGRCGLFSRMCIDSDGIHEINVLRQLLSLPRFEIPKESSYSVEERKLRRASQSKSQINESIHPPSVGNRARP